MLREKNSLALTFTTFTDPKSDTLLKLPLESSLTIVAKDDVTWLPIAYVKWNPTINDCYIETIADRFQTYIVLYETFCDFIYLVDDAFDRMRAAHQ